MAKKKAEAVKPWPLQVEDACRRAVSAIPGFDATISEREWCEAVSEGLGVYKDTIDARLQELAQEEEDE